MKKTKLVASCLAVGIFAISASVQAASRASTQTAQPLKERILTDDTRAAGAPPIACNSCVYENFGNGTSFYPQDPATDELQLQQRVLDDMGLAPGNNRELISYVAQIHQRSSEGPAGFTGYLSLYGDDGTGAESLPTDPIDGTACTIADLHGLGRPDEGLAVCIPNAAGDSGIIIPDKTWLQVIFEGGCTGDEPLPDGCPDAGTALGPGWLLGPATADPGGTPTVGSTEGTWALCQGDICILANFSGNNGFLCNASAGTPAPVPTVSEWGMVLIAMLVLTGGTIVLRRSRRSVATA